MLRKVIDTPMITAGTTGALPVAKKPARILNRPSLLLSITVPFGDEGLRPRGQRKSHGCGQEQVGKHPVSHARWLCRPRQVTERPSALSGSSADTAAAAATSPRCRDTERGWCGAPHGCLALGNRSVSGMITFIAIFIIIAQGNNGSGAENSLWCLPILKSY